MSINKLFGTPAVPKGVNVDFSGEWVNELHSTININVLNDGLISGEYSTGKGAPTPVEKFAVTGFISNDQISFTVNFGKYGTLTSWVGQLTIEQGQEVIKTTWVLSRNVPDQDEEAQLWGTVMTGSNTFSRKI